MAEKDKKYYWLRLKRDFFKRHDIQIIESMPNGKDYILFYLKLLCESVDHEGNLRFSEQIPYNEQMLSTITNTNVDIVRSAIKIFSELGMMEVLDDGTYYMAEVNKMLGSETYWAERKRIQKAKTINNEFQYIRVLSAEQFALPNGDTKFIDEKRYGGNGKAVWDRARGQCEICGSTDNLCIHHNNGYSNEIEDLVLVCRSCHRKIETGEIGKFPTESNSFPTCPSKSKSKRIDKDIKKEILKKESDKIPDFDLEAAWKKTRDMYPRNDGKGISKQLYLNVFKELSPLVWKDVANTISIAIKLYIKDCKERYGEEEKYIKGMDKWFKEDFDYYFDKADEVRKQRSEGSE